MLLLLEVTMYTCLGEAAAPDASCERRILDRVLGELVGSAEVKQQWQAASECILQCILLGRDTAPCLARPQHWTLLQPWPLGIECGLYLFLSATLRPCPFAGVFGVSVLQTRARPLPLDPSTTSSNSSAPSTWVPWCVKQASARPAHPTISAPLSPPTHPATHTSRRGHSALPTLLCCAANCN